MPGSNEQLRALCYSCNCTRGCAELSDEAVLQRISKWYREILDSRFLWWLNTEPGAGGRPHRNESTARREEKLAGQRDTGHNKSAMEAMPECTTPPAPQSEEYQW